MKKTEEVLNSIQKSNKKYNQFEFIPSYDMYKNFEKVSTSFFSNPEGKRFYFSAKDIFNTYVYPTEMGSQTFKDFFPGNNARVITDCITDGDFCIGKTVTSEFAVHEETDVLNPWNSSATVGTSSAGSAINILVDQDIDYSLATQTAGSIGRPASYCGVRGFKPSYGLVPRTGVLKTCDPFDTVGFFIKTFDVLEKVMNTTFKISSNFPQNKKIHVLKKLDTKNFIIPSIEGISFSKESEEHVDEVKSFLIDNGYSFLDIQLPEFVSQIHNMHEKIYSFSLSYYFTQDLESRGSKLSDSFKNFVERCKAVESQEFQRLIDLHQKYVQDFNNWLYENSIDLILFPSTNGVAPKRGDPEMDDLNLIMTYLHLPVCYIPAGFNEKLRMPFGIGISGKRFADYALVELAKEIESNFPQNGGKYFEEV